jgi:hypothetical protein
MWQLIADAQVWQREEQKTALTTDSARASMPTDDSVD